jgi:hypothetical protein
VKLKAEVLPLLLAIDVKCWMASKHKNQRNRNVSWHTEQLQELVIIVSVAKYNFLSLMHIGSIRVSSHITMMSRMEQIATAIHHSKLHSTYELGVIQKLLVIITIITINVFR